VFKEKKFRFRFAGKSSAEYISDNFERRSDFRRLSVSSGFCLPSVFSSRVFSGFRRLAGLSSRVFSGFRRLAGLSSRVFSGLL
jgi:hypothetical protein